jgi:sodium/hydrogen exchanger-like protein 6/7
MKHYAYYNMSRRTQLSTKYIFQVLAQLTENFIFIYLGLTLSTGDKLSFKPLFILMTVIGICVARWCAVFPLSKLINWVIRYRASKRGYPDQIEELPYSYQAMLFWAGLRGAVGVALAEGFSEKNEGEILKATVLVVVVLTVIIFGGTTARMLEILGIQTGVVEELDSDDEFDIEVDNGTFYKRGASLNPRRANGNGVSLSNLDEGISSGQNGFGNYNNMRRGSVGKSVDPSHRNLLSEPSSFEESEEEPDVDTSDLPPAVAPRRRTSPRLDASGPPTQSVGPHGEPMTFSSTTAALGQLLRGSTDDHAEWFRQLDEGIIKPWVLLDGQNKNGQAGRGSGSGV